MHRESHETLAKVQKHLQHQKGELDEVRRALDLLRREDLRLIRQELRETRNALHRQSVGTGKLLHDISLVREQKVVEERVLAWISRQVKRDRPLVFGPWTGEVGFELIYWVPFLRYVAQRFKLPPERIIILSRGGTFSWYQDFASAYLDVFDFVTPSQLQHALKQKKQREVSAFERRLLASVRQRLGVDRLSVIHPLLMYRMYMPYWKETDSIRRVERFAASSSMPSSAPRPGLELPERYVAVRFYFSDCLPDTPANRACIEQIMQSLASHSDVVVLDPGFRIDDHTDWAAGTAHRVHRLDAVMTPSNNLAIQTAAIRGAAGFVGTYGGFSYLAPLCGIDAVALYSEKNFYASHLERAQRMLVEVGGGQLVPLDTRALGMVRQAVGSFRAASAH